MVASWAAFNLRGQVGRLWLGLSGVVSILAGIVAFVDTGITAFALLVFIAVWAIMIGALQLYAASRLWKIIDNDWWLILSGLLSVAFGAALIGWPSAGALALIWSIVAVVFGCMFVGLSGPDSLHHLTTARSGDMPTLSSCQPTGSSPPVGWLWSSFDCGVSRSRVANEEARATNCRRAHISFK
jgi:hypothetical protein